jgi:phosphate acyltransferase
VLPIAIDVMSGDHPPPEYIAGALAALREDQSLRALLVGDATLIEARIASLAQALRARLEVVPASQVVAMTDSAREAIRRKKDSSMRVAIDLVKAGRASACVSAGNTGALNAIAHFVLKTLPGVERAAIISAIPAAHGHTHMLDLGANTKATPEQLRQFAAMGAIISRDVFGLASPRIGLLNIGEEDIKGHEVVQAAHLLLATSHLNYVGFVEGDDIFSGDVDVVVTDGFTGNVALKTMEGAAGLIADRMRREFRASWLDRLAGLAARPVLRRVAASLDPRKYNGACMVGLTGIVVKSHGRADGVAFARAIITAALAARRGLTAHIAQALAAQGADSAQGSTT